MFFTLGLIIFTVVGLIVIGIGKLIKSRNHERQSEFLPKDTMAHHSNTDEHNFDWAQFDGEIPSDSYKDDVG